MSDTPRTDEHAPELPEGWMEFSKTLERELAAMTKERDELRKHADALADDLQAYLRDVILISDKSPVTKATTRLLSAYRASQTKP
jgi:hypothetical protein